MFSGVSAMRLLLVDDEESLRNLLQYMLENEGVEVTDAPDGAAALDLIRTGRRFDVMVADISMPRMDGYQLLSTLREEGVQLPTVLVGGLRRLTADECAVLGAGPMLLKPFTIPQLMTAVHDALRRNGREL
jgi:DNA-binding response OmpR family regulator